MARNGTEAVVYQMPSCDIHKYDDGIPGVEAAYDVKTIDGRWANVCEAHFKTHAMYPTLGTGKGQRLILKSDA